MFDTGGTMHNWRFGPKRDGGCPGRFAMADMKETAQEDSFLWSMADLMTLLLIFFVLLYADAMPKRAAATSVPEALPTTVEAPVEMAQPDTPVVQKNEIIEEKHMVAEDPPPSSQAVPADVLATATPPPFESAAEPESVVEVEPGETTAPDMPLHLEMMESLKDSFNDDFYLRWDEKAPVFVLGEQITFDVGQARLLAGSQSALQRIADLIEPLADYRIVVSGHTDNVTIRTPKFPSNWELSAARAASVAKFLVVQGVAPQRLVIQGKSEYHPLVANTSEKNRKMNRRVEIALVQDTPTPAPSATNP